MKHKLLMAHLKEGAPFGRVIADVSVIEFQKRGILHAHIICFSMKMQSEKLKIPR